MQEVDQYKLLYEDALNRFLQKVKKDSNVIAVIVCGSMAYDQVWKDSDMDVSIILKDQSIEKHSYSVTENNITINVDLYTRSYFKRLMERTIGGAFVQSYFSKGTMVYTTDESLLDFFEELKTPGQDDLDLAILMNAGELIGNLQKARKWYYLKKDYHYCQYYLLNASDLIARIIICLNGESPTREAFQRAMKLDQATLLPLYPSLLKKEQNKDELLLLIQYVEDFITKHLDRISSPILEYLEDGEIKTMTMFEKYFHSEGHFLSHILDYLVEAGVIEKATQYIRISPKGPRTVEEIAYLYMKS